MQPIYRMMCFGFVCGAFLLGKKVVRKRTKPSVFNKGVYVKQDVSCQKRRRRFSSDCYGLKTGVCASGDSHLDLRRTPLLMFLPLLIPEIIAEETSILRYLPNPLDMNHPLESLA